MKRIRIIYLSALLLPVLLWLASDPEIWSASGFFPIRNTLVQLTGIIGMSVMSVALFLAIRPARIEPLFGGLDKSYRLHKWLGISALVVAVIHWLWAQGPKWAVGWGWLERPARGRAGPPADALEHFMRSQRGLAESIGEWAFYAAVLLIVLALIKRFPYRYFHKTHRLIAIVYLFLVFHALILFKTDWGSAIGLLLGSLMAVGVIAAFTSLFGKVGCRRRAVGVVEELEHHSEDRVLKVVIRLMDRWAGHKAGQFAFVTFDRSEGPHPFTISSAWSGDGKLRFHIKALGDYTTNLPRTLQVGDLATVEGPYGCFDFRGNRPGQIWVAGGIGITPFMARMQSLSHRAHEQPVHLFFSTNAPDERFIADLQRLAKSAGVTLHIYVPHRDGHLTAERLVATVPEWQRSDVWFCGPAPFGASLRQGLMAHGLSADDFHQELFSMR
ncbi:ferredoxin reductase family protein [Thiohalomonas denitrificans]|uniref:ferredoxin reductase family protein n=1 Tax=Thiohalomonas denitrificans TaxID=415747 RepID=UPI0026EC5936|nr:ferric reductase-like transmembrane domain-containing protein [Thiohalomonas denitrificans]